jgi:hypothetical protein
MHSFLTYAHSFTSLSLSLSLCLSFSLHFTRVCQVPDYDSGVDPYGNALSCTCELGYLRVEQWRIE